MIKSCILFLVLVGSLSAQPPPLPTVKMAWDYPSNAAAANFLLLWGNTNRIYVGTNKEASVFNAVPRTYVFQAAATNISGAATSGPTTVRVVRVLLDSGPTPTGPWTVRQMIYDVVEIGTNNAFFRSRVEIQQ